MRNRYVPIITVLAILFFAGSSQAQITIGSGDLESAGDTFRVSMGQAFTGMDPTLTGANYTWDYSQLTSSSQTVDTFLNVNNTNIAYVFVFGNIAFNPNRSNVAAKGADITSPLFSVTDVYNFYYNSASSYSQTGFGGSISGIPVPTVYNPQDRIYSLPLHFGDTDTCTSAYAIDLNSTLHVYFSAVKHRNNSVDGWGSLTTPFGTFNALRIKSVVNEHDSVHIDTIVHIGYGTDLPELVEYKWLGVNSGIPLLQINTSAGAVSQIVYRDSVRGNTLAVLPVQKENFDFNVYPNPAPGKFFLQYNLGKAAHVSVDVFSLTGEQIFSESCGKKMPGDNFLWIDCSEKNLAAGSYFVKLNVDGKIFQKQLIINE